MDDHSEAKTVMGLATELMAKLEAQGIKLDTRGLGPALIVLGMTVAAKNNEQAMAMKAVVAAGTTSGILRKPEDAFAKMRENPQALAAFLQSVIGPEGKVVMDAVDAPKARRYPWKQ
jgi:hypothetical protein